MELSLSVICQGFATENPKNLLTFSLNPHTPFDSFITFSTSLLSNPHTATSLPSTSASSPILHHRTSSPPRTHSSTKPLLFSIFSVTSLLFFTSTNPNLRPSFQPPPPSSVASSSQNSISHFRTCEICGSTAQNVAGVVEAEMIKQLNEENEAFMPPTGRAAPTAETQSFWQGHQFLIFLLACMVFAFVISWVFHFNVAS